MAVRPVQNNSPLATLAYAGVRAGLFLPSVAPLGVALETARRIGRGFGSLPSNKKRVARASGALAQAFPDSDEDWRRETALRSYEHLAMLGVELTAVPRVITPDAWGEHVEIGDMSAALRALLADRPTVLITGHCGNWEVLAATLGVLGFPMHALYRPLDLQPLDMWLRRTRANQGIDLVDKFGAAEILPRLFENREPVGFVADQNAGDRALFVPFMGRLTSTYKTIGLLTKQYNATVVCGHARRLDWDAEKPVAGTGPALGRRVGQRGLHYRIDVTDVFGPGDYNHQPDPLFYIAARYRKAIEDMIRSSPEQYLWMHRIWKSRPPHERKNSPFPPRLREKLEQLPWFTDADVDAIVDRSDRDRALLQELGTDRLP